MPAYTEKQLSQLINDVEKQFTAHLAKAEEDFKLAKSEDGEDKSKKKDEEKHAEHEQKHAEKEAEHADKEAAHAEKEHEMHAEHEKEDEKHDGEHEEGHDYDDEDMDHMHKLYMSMSKAELKAHHDAIRKAHDHHGLAKCIEEEHPGHIPGEQAPASKEQDEISKHGLSPAQIKAKLAKADGNGGEMEAAPPKGAEGPLAPASKDQKNLSNMEKMETGKIEAAPPKGALGPKSKASEDQRNLNNMEKSELSPEVELLKTELEAQKAKSDDLKKSLDAVSEFLTKLVKKTAPQGKAITSETYIAKSEVVVEEKPLSKSEVTAILNKKVVDPKLEDKDRKAINAFYLENASIDSIRHLLK